MLKSVINGFGATIGVFLGCAVLGGAKALIDKQVKEHEVNKQDHQYNENKNEHHQ